MNNKQLLLLTLIAFTYSDKVFCAQAAAAALKDPQDQMEIDSEFKQYKIGNSLFCPQTDAQVSDDKTTLTVCTKKGWLELKATQTNGELTVSFFKNGFLAKDTHLSLITYVAIVGVIAAHPFFKDYDKVDLLQKFLTKAHKEQDPKGVLHAITLQNLGDEELNKGFKRNILWVKNTQKIYLELLIADGCFGDGITIETFEPFFQ